MTTASCNTCRFWMRVAEDRKAPGLCRRRAPVPIMLGAQMHPARGQVPIIQGFFPETGAGAWCGDHEGAQVGNGAMAIDLSRLSIEGEAQ